MVHPTTRGDVQFVPVENDVDRLVIEILDDPTVGFEQIKGHLSGRTEADIKRIE